jgi:hypothetical protein
VSGVYEWKDVDGVVGGSKRQRDAIDAERARADVIGFAEMPFKLRKEISALRIRVGRGNSKAVTHYLTTDQRCPRSADLTPLGFRRPVPSP